MRHSERAALPVHPQPGMRSKIPSRPSDCMSRGSCGNFKLPSSSLTACSNTSNKSSLTVPQPQIRRCVIASLGRHLWNAHEHFADDCLDSLLVSRQLLSMWAPNDFAWLCVSACFSHRGSVSTAAALKWKIGKVEGEGGTNSFECIVQHWHMPNSDARTHAMMRQDSGSLPDLGSPSRLLPGDAGRAAAGRPADAGRGAGISRKHTNYSSKSREQNILQRLSRRHRMFHTQCSS